MLLARNMSVVEVRPQPIHPGHVAITPAASPARENFPILISQRGLQASMSPKQATTTELAARATGTRAAHSETPKHLKLRATIQYPQTG